MGQILASRSCQHRAHGHCCALYALPGGEEGRVGRDWASEAGVVFGANPEKPGHHGAGQGNQGILDVGLVGSKEH